MLTRIFLCLLCLVSELVRAEDVPLLQCSPWGEADPPAYLPLRFGPVFKDDPKQLENFAFPGIAAGFIFTRGDGKQVILSLHGNSLSVGKSKELAQWKVDRIYLTDGDKIPFLGQVYRFDGNAPYHLRLVPGHELALPKKAAKGVLQMPFGTSLVVHDEQMASRRRIWLNVTENPERKTAISDQEKWLNAHLGIGDGRTNDMKTMRCKLHVGSSAIVGDWRYTVVRIVQPDAAQPMCGWIDFKITSSFEKIPGENE